MRLVLVPVRGDLATQLQVARPSDPLGEIPLPARVSTNSRGHPPLEHCQIPPYRRVHLMPLAGNIFRMG